MPRAPAMKSTSKPSSVATQGGGTTSVVSFCEACGSKIDLPPYVATLKYKYGLKCTGCQTSDKTLLSGWLDVILTVLYNLERIHDGQRYFHWKKQICEYIRHHWPYLFPDGSVNIDDDWEGQVRTHIQKHRDLFVSLGSQKWALRLYHATGIPDVESIPAITSKSKATSPLRQSKRKGKGQRKKRASKASGAAGAKKPSASKKKPSPSIISKKSSKKAKAAAVPTNTAATPSVSVAKFVEDIFAKRIISGTAEYLIKVQGVAEILWESRQAIDCPSLIQEFEVLSGSERFARPTAPPVEGRVEGVDDIPRKCALGEHDASVRVNKIPRSNFCHHCKRYRAMVVCCDNLTIGKCDRKYCERCLESYYSKSAADILKDASHKSVATSVLWECPLCMGFCLCSECLPAGAGAHLPTDEVETILAGCVMGGGELHYLVKFRNKSMEEAKWLAESALGPAEAAQHTFRHALRLRLRGPGIKRKRKSSSKALSKKCDESLELATSRVRTTPSRFRSKSTMSGSPRSQQRRKSDSRRTSRKLGVSDFDISGVIMNDTALSVKEIIIPTHSDIFIPTVREVPSVDVEALLAAEESSEENTSDEEYTMRHLKYEIEFPRKKKYRKAAELELSASGGLGTPLRRRSWSEVSPRKRLGLGAGARQALALTPPERVTNTHEGKGVHKRLAEVLGENDAPRTPKRGRGESDSTDRGVARGVDVNLVLTRQDDWGAISLGSALHEESSAGVSDDDTEESSGEHLVAHGDGNTVTNPFHCEDAPMDVDGEQQGEDYAGRSERDLDGEKGGNAGGTYVDTLGNHCTAEEDKNEVDMDKLPAQDLSPPSDICDKVDDPPNDPSDPSVGAMGPVTLTARQLGRESFDVVLSGDTDIVD